MNKKQNWLARIFGKAEKEMSKPLELGIQVSRSEIGATVAAVTPEKQIDPTATVAVGGSNEQADIGATMMVGGQVDPVALRQAEQAVATEWKPGDVILDLYEVRKVTEGFGEDAVEKDYHKGGFGRVYKVWHRGWNMELAVKVPRPEAYNTPTKKENFLKECETWINLGLHPHVAACNYIRVLGSIPRVFSEYATAGTLEDWISSGRLYEGGEEAALERILDIAIQFAWGLHHAHEHEGGIIHQDVKPLNLLMMEDGTAKVCDFGLAKARTLPADEGISGVGDGGHTMMVTGGGGYTPAYCSPEQLSGEKLTRKTDIWSWGLSVLVMFQGEVTWQSGSLAGMALEAFLQHNGEEDGIPSMPDGVAQLLRQCFQQSPEDRPKTMHVCATALTVVYESETGHVYPRTEPKPADIMADGLNNRALSFLDLGKSDEAERLFDDILRIHPNHVLATYNRGLMLWRAGRITDEMILKLLRACEQSAPNDPQVALCQGWIEWERGDFTVAAEHFKKAVEEGGGIEAQSALDGATLRTNDSAGCLRGFEDECLNSISSVFLSTDGQKALLYGFDNKFTLWDIATSQCIRTFQGNTEGTTSICLSADELLALSVSSDNTLKLWDTVTGKCLRAFEGHTDLVSAVGLSADGHWALSGSNDNTLKFWDTMTGQCLRTLKGHSEGVRSISMSMDGHWALSGGYDNLLLFWDLLTGKCLQKFNRPRFKYKKRTSVWVNSVCLSEDKRLALAGHNDATLTLWDTSTGQCLRIFEGHTSYVTSVYFTTDGRWILSGSADETVRLWDVVTGQCLRTFRGHMIGVKSISMSLDGRRVIFGSETNQLLILNMGQLIRMNRKDVTYVYSHIMKFSDLVNIHSRIESVINKVTALLQTDHAAIALEILREARVLPRGERNNEILDLWYQAGRHMQRKGLIAAWQQHTLLGHDRKVSSVCLNRDGHWALSGSGYGESELKLWDMATGQCLRTFEGDTKAVNSVCFSVDERWALSGGGDNTLKLWDVVTGQCLRTFEGHAKAVNSVCLSADGRWALSGSDDTTLKLWDMVTGQCLRTFEGHTEGIYTVCLSGNDRLALSGSSDETVRLWDLVSGECVRTFGENKRKLYERPNGVRSVCLSGDRKWMLSGHGDDRLRLWEMSSGRCVRTFTGYMGVLSSEGRWLLSANSDNNLKLWETAAGQCLWTFEGHTSPACSLFLSSDGRWALSGSHDNTLRLWELEWDYEAVEPADWAEGARPYLENFLTLHTPYVKNLPVDSTPSGEEVALALTRRGRPSWIDEDFQRLLETLANAGYGWLRPEGVRHELEKVAVDWQGPPPLEEMGFDSVKGSV